jgi:hypothetical protein
MTKTLRRAGRALDATTAVLVRVDSGQYGRSDLLVRLWGGCLDGGAVFGTCRRSIICAFSHLHRDTCGLASVTSFRCGLRSRHEANPDLGPTRNGAKSCTIAFRGFLWTLHANHDRDVAGHRDRHKTRLPLFRYMSSPNAFEMRSWREGLAHDSRSCLKEPRFVVEAYTMDHRTPTIAYVVREKNSQQHRYGAASGDGRDAQARGWKSSRKCPDSTESVSDQWSVASGWPIRVGDKRSCSSSDPRDSFRVSEPTFCWTRVAMAEQGGWRGGGGGGWRVLKGCKPSSCEKPVSTHRCWNRPAHTFT